MFESLFFLNYSKFETKNINYDNLWIDNSKRSSVVTSVFDANEKTLVSDQTR